MNLYVFQAIVEGKSFSNIRIKPVYEDIFKDGFQIIKEKTIICIINIVYLYVIKAVINMILTLCAYI